MSTFTMQEQKLDQWCWAAVAVSIANYVKPDSAPSQCEVASRVFTKVSGGCCGGSISDACDQPATLTQALDAVHHDAGVPILGPLKFTKIQEVIDGGWPIPVRIVWEDNPGNAHFVVISGYAFSQVGDQLLQVDDPFYGRSIVDYETFVSSYHASGRWERSYPLT